MGRFVSLGRVDAGSEGERGRDCWGRGTSDAGGKPSARYEDARGWDGRDDDRDRRSFDRRGYGDDYGRGGEDHLDRRRSYDSRGGADVGSWRSERNGYGFRDRDDGFPRGGRLSADREKTWRRREEPEPLKPVEPSPPPRARQSMDVKRTAEGALDKLHIPHGDYEWGQEEDDFGEIPSWLQQQQDARSSERGTNQVPAPRKGTSPVQPKPKREMGHFNSAKLPDHLKQPKRAEGEEKKLWTPPEPIGGVKKRPEKASITSPKATPAPKAVPVARRSQDEPRAIPEPKLRNNKAEGKTLPKVSPKTPPSPQLPPSAAKGLSLAPPNPPPPSPHPPPNLSRAQPPIPPGKPPPLPPMPPPPLPQGMPPGVQPPLPSGKPPPLPPKPHASPDMTKLSISEKTTPSKNAAKKKKVQKVPSSGNVSSSEAMRVSEGSEKPKAKPTLKKTSRDSSTTDLSSDGGSQKPKVKPKAASKAKPKAGLKAPKGQADAAQQRNGSDEANRRVSIDAIDMSRASSKMTI